MPDDGGTARLWATWARNFASALVAGGAGVVLTMVLSDQGIGTETYVALQVLFALLLTGVAVSLQRAARRAGRTPPRRDLVYATGLVMMGSLGVSLLGVAYGGWTWPLASQGVPWWLFVGEGLLAAFVGGTMRFAATELLASIPRPGVAG